MMNIVLFGRVSPQLSCLRRETTKSWTTTERERLKVGLLTASPKKDETRNTNYRVLTVTSERRQGPLIITHMRRVKFDKLTEFLTHGPTYIKARMYEAKRSGVS